MYTLAEEVIKVLKGRKLGETRLSTLLFNGVVQMASSKCLCQANNGSTRPKISFGVCSNLVCSHICRQQQYHQVVYYRPLFPRRRTSLLEAFRTEFKFHK